MASLALHLKSHHTLKPSITLLKLTPSFHYFSSSSSNNNQNNNKNDTFSSSSNNNEINNKKKNDTFFNDIKSNLKHYQQQQKQQQIEPYPFASSLASIKSQLTHHQKHQQSTNEGVSPSIIASLGSSSSLKQGIDFKAIKESLRELGTTRTGNNRRNSMSFNYKDSNFKPNLEMGDNFGGKNSVIGSGVLPLSVFGKEMKEKNEGKGENGGTEVENWMRVYNVDDLGKKLREFRPENKEKNGGFSLSELNERLKKVKENDDMEMAAKKGSGYVEFRKSLRTLKVEPKSSPKMVPSQAFDILAPGTPSFMLHPPKEHLVEKYFHPDNMSAEEKLKLELKKVRDEFKMHESDCGSARVQVAQLTTEILHLSSVLHKKDKHSRRGLQAKVQQRKKLLKYLRRTDWESYCFVLSKLGLRDNPDYKN